MLRDAAIANRLTRKVIRVDGSGEHVRSKARFLAGVVVLASVLYVLLLSVSPRHVAADLSLLSGAQFAVILGVLMFAVRVVIKILAVTARQIRHWLALDQVVLSSGAATALDHSSVQTVRSARDKRPPRH